MVPQPFPAHFTARHHYSSPSSLGCSQLNLNELSTALLPGPGPHSPPATIPPRTPRLSEQPVLTMTVPDLDLSASFHAGIFSQHLLWPVSFQSPQCLKDVRVRLMTLAPSPSVSWPHQPLGSSPHGFYFLRPQGLCKCFSLHLDVYSPALHLGNIFLLLESSQWALSGKRSRIP